MKNYFFMLLLAFGALTISCEKDPETDTNTTPVEGEKSAYIDASDGAWYYFCLEENKMMGSGIEDPAINEEWFARTDWDFAIKKYEIRTNSGLATSVSSKGGLYPTDKYELAEVTALPEVGAFLLDEEVTLEGMMGPTIEIKSPIASKYQGVIGFQTDEEGSMIMPPTYTESPVYIFRTADGNSHYKVDFTQYLNENNISGHVKFNFVKM